MAPRKAPPAKHAGGRPPMAPELRRVRVDVTLSPAAIENLDELARRWELGRSAAIERLIVDEDNGATRG